MCLFGTLDCRCPRSSRNKGPWSQLRSIAVRIYTGMKQDYVEFIFKVVHLHMFYLSEGRWTSRAFGAGTAGLLKIGALFQKG